MKMNRKQRRAHAAKPTDWKRVAQVGEQYRKHLAQMAAVLVERLGRYEGDAGVAQADFELADLTRAYDLGIEQLDGHGIRLTAVRV